MATNKVGQVQPQPQQQPQTSVGQNSTVQKENKFEISDLLSKGAAVVLTTPTATAGAIYLVGKFIEGAVTKKSIDQAMTEGIQDVGQGAEMLTKMWNGQYF